VSDSAIGIENVLFKCQNASSQSCEITDTADNADTLNSTRLSRQFAHAWAERSLLITIRRSSGWQINASGSGVVRSNFHIRQLISQPGKEVGGDAAGLNQNDET
jgi:hypothetical protein